jgi:hypothetical protein
MPAGRHERPSGQHEHFLWRAPRAPYMPPVRTPGK